MPRFVLLYHKCPPGYERPSHWDLMLEADDVLRTWALPQLPRDWQGAQAATAISQNECPLVASGDVVPAEQLGAHRLAYLDFEGPVSGNRGHVTRIDTGTFTTPVESAARLDAILAGKLLRGIVSLHRASPNDPHWQLTWLAQD